MRRVGPAYIEVRDMGYDVKRRGETVRTFDCFHEALAYGRIVGDNYVTDQSGMVLAVHGNPGDADERKPHETNALRRAQHQNDKLSGHAYRAPAKHFEHAVHDEHGCRHDWQRMAHDATSFRCGSCGALGYQTTKPSRYAEDRPVLARRCVRHGCRDVARHAGVNGYRRGLCDVHHAATEVAA